MTNALPAVRRYSGNEVRADAFIHVVGILFAIGASVWLPAHVTGLPATISILIYCAGLLLMIAASAGYHLNRRPSAKEILRRIDHAAIFIMIAATYTPFAANRLDHGTGTDLLAAVWLCAAAGVALKLAFPRRFERLSLVFYLVMGWMIVAVAKPLSTSVTSIDLWLLFSGGVVYSAGVVFFLLERIPFQKAIWHGFVLAAVVLQFAAITGEFAA